MIKFGTGGFRGIIGDDFTKKNVQIVTQALCNIIHSKQSKKPVVVGYDFRFISDFACDWVAEVCAGNGIECWIYNEVMPTPAIMSVVAEHHLDYGIMITASHNPYYYNGMKVFVKGMDADVEFTRILEKETTLVHDVHVIQRIMVETSPYIKRLSFKQEYLDKIKSFIHPDIKNNHAKILYNNLFGVGFKGLKPLAKEYNIEQFDIINDYQNALFNKQLPNPTPENMSKLKQSVIDGHYDYAIATDSDGDRLGVLDENGECVNNNDILACIYYYLVQYRHMQGDIVKNCATSVIIDKLANKLGYKCHEVDVGFKNISSKMKETNALIGGESSGGLTVRNYIMGKDSVFSGSLFMEMQIMMKKSVSEIIKEVKDFADYHQFFCENNIVFDNTDKIRKYLDENDPTFDLQPIKIEKYNNNYKYTFDDGWLLIRFSGTEPIVRLFAETNSQEECDYQINNIIDCLKRSLNA